MYEKQRTIQQEISMSGIGLHTGNNCTMTFKPAPPEWDAYLGQYQMFYLGTSIGPVTISKKNGYLYYDDARCMEYEDGLFFRFDGEALDFRGETPTIGQRELYRIE
jgi:hypothetical protein